MAKRRAAKKPAKKPAKKSSKKSAKKPAKKPAKKAAKRAAKKSARKPAKKAAKRSTRRPGSGPALLAANPSRRAPLPPAPAATATAAPPAPRAAPAAPAPDLRAAFDAAFAASPVQVRAIGVRLRRIVLDALRGAREEPFGGDRVRGLRYYAEERHLSPVCSIQPGPDHCQLYFKDGSRLTDPLRLLLGSGDGIRHVRVATLDLPPESALRDLIAQARALAR